MFVLRCGEFGSSSESERRVMPERTLVKRLAHIDAVRWHTQQRVHLRFALS